jgi:F1F0 ATPase subunit 2
MFTLSSLLVPFVLGGLIGWVYFFGLWETVRRLPESKSPHGLMILSFAARTLFALGGFYILADGQWERTAASVSGFFIVKLLLVRGFGRTAKPFSTGAVSWKS